MLRRRNENPSIYRALQNDIIILSRTDSNLKSWGKKQEIFRVVVDSRTHPRYPVDTFRASDM